MSHYNPKRGEEFVEILEDKTYKSWCDIKRKTKIHLCCERWRKSYQNFYDDMGQKPEGIPNQYLLGRKDTSKEFSPDNCAWMTRSEQAKHRKARKQ